VIHEYRGVIHVHSTFSDGRAGIDKIMSEANRAEVDFLILTDHNGIEAKLRGTKDGTTTACSSLARR